MSVTTNFISKVFGKSNVKNLENLAYSFKKKFKVVVFAPADKADEIIYAMASAGAGQIGRYTVCSFRTEGVGTFKPGDGSSPFIGKKGKLEMADEVRIEMVCGMEHLNDAIDKMYEVHPYDEPACEIYNIRVRSRKPEDKIVKLVLKKSVKLQSVLNKVNNVIDSDNIPAKIKSAHVKDVIVNFSGNDRLKLPPGRKQKILYITKNSNRSINIQLI